MAAQEYYRDDYGSRPHSPPTNATGSDFDRFNASDADEDIPGRVTSPHLNVDFDNDRLSASPTPSHQRNDSALSDAPGYGDPNRGTPEEGNSPYGRNYNVANQDSKEALVPGVRGRRTSGYQDLGSCFAYIVVRPPSCLPPGYF